MVNETVSESNESRSRNTRISAAKLPDRRRLESKGGQMASMRIFDGQACGSPRPSPNQFERQDQNSDSFGYYHKGSPASRVYSCCFLKTIL